MTGTKSATWIIGTVVFAFLLVAAGWMLGISPLLETTAEMQEETEFEQARIDQLEITLAGLERDAENLDKFYADLAALRVGIPDELEFTEVTRRLNTMAAEAGVVITGIGTTTVTGVTPPASAEPEPTVTEPTGDAAESDASDAVADSATDGTGTTSDTAAPTSMLYAVPVEIATVGSYDATIAFLAKLQTIDSRLILVGNLVESTLEEAGAQGGLPAILDGFIDSRISAWVFVLPGTDTPVEGEGVPEEVDVIPVPSGQKNPFEPLA
jgi:Tfp pilus assembly protein PilO